MKNKKILTLIPLLILTSCSSGNAVYEECFNYIKDYIESLGLTYTGQDNDYFGIETSESEYATSFPKEGHEDLSMVYLEKYYSVDNDVKTLSNWVEVNQDCSTYYSVEKKTAYSNMNYNFLNTFTSGSTVSYVFNGDMWMFPDTVTNETCEYSECVRDEQEIYTYEVLDDFDIYNKPYQVKEWSTFGDLHDIASYIFAPETFALSCTYYEYFKVGTSGTYTSSIELEKKADENCFETTITNTFDNYGIQHDDGTDESNTYRSFTNGEMSIYMKVNYGVITKLNFYYDVAITFDVVDEGEAYTYCIESSLEQTASFDTNMTGYMDVPEDYRDNIGQ